jgi:hypothetical protein
MRILTIAIAALGLGSSALGAQGNDPDKVVAEGGVKVPGWTGRIDPQAAAHPEAYGVFIAGKDLETPGQSYLYFLIRQDGKYLINHRANDSTVHKMVDWTANSAVKPIDADGKATNALSVVVGGDKLSFLVNGTEVTTLPRSQVDRTGAGSGTSGVTGIRVNHNLDVHVGSFAVSPGK